MPIWSKLTIHRSYLFWMIAFCPSFPRFLFPSYSATVSPACSKASRWMRIWIREWWRTGQVGGMERLYMMALLVSKTLYVHPEPWGIFAFWTIYYFQFGWNHQLDDGLVGWFSLESDQIRHAKLTIASVHIYIYIYVAVNIMEDEEWLHDMVKMIPDFFAQSMVVPLHRCVNRNISDIPNHAELMWIDISGDWLCPFGGVSPYCWWKKYCTT